MPSEGICQPGIPYLQIHVLVRSLAKNSTGVSLMIFHRAPVPNLRMMSCWLPQFMNMITSGHNIAVNVNVCNR